MQRLGGELTFGNEKYNRSLFRGYAGKPALGSARAPLRCRASSRAGRREAGPSPSTPHKPPPRLQRGVRPAARPGLSRACEASDPLAAQRPSRAPLPCHSGSDAPAPAPAGSDASMEKSSSEDSSIHRSPSLDSGATRTLPSRPPRAARSAVAFTAGAFYGTAGSCGQSHAEAGVKTDKYNAPKGSKYVVFYLDLSFVFLLEFKKCNRPGAACAASSTRCSSSI